MKRIRFIRMFAVAAAFGLMFAGFQNCTQLNSGYKAKTSTKLAGNGDGYSGKSGDLYRRFDSGRPCLDNDRDGNPLPNSQIFYQSKTPGGGKEPHVVRENCQDVVPQPIPQDDVKLDGSLLSFQGREFSNYKADADFQVLAAACPAGKSPIPGARRSNLIVNSQDWTEQPVYQGWMWHSGIIALLNGSIMSLPAYSIVRHDTAFPEEFRRISQIKQLKGSTDYAFSFLAKKGTRDTINFRYYRVDEATKNEEYLNVDFNLVTGTAAARWLYNLPPAAFTMTPVGEGFFCTVYFTTSPTGGLSHSDFGISPSAGSNGATQVGDSVFATAAQLEATGGYCQ